MVTTSRKKSRSRDKGSARVAFTPRHQRNCMRGNKQNYKALAGPDYFSASSLPRFSFSLSLSVFIFLIIFLSLSLSFSSCSLDFFASWNLLALLLALLSLRLSESRNASVRLTQTWHRLSHVNLQGISKPKSSNSPFSRRNINAIK